jgi:hypothetical protein
MSSRKRVARLLLATLLVISAASAFAQRAARATPEQMRAVEALYQASERCVFEVRDGRKRYDDDATSCKSLGSLSLAYLRAGGAEATTAYEVEYRFAQAQSNAWMARAISEAGGNPMIFIW